MKDKKLPEEKIIEAEMIETINWKQEWENLKNNKIVIICATILGGLYKGFKKRRENGKMVDKNSKGTKKYKT